MSKLEELIQQFCPDGVEQVLVENVIISLNTGLNPRRFFKLNTEDATNYYVTIRELQNDCVVFSDKTDRINDNALKLCNNRSNLEVGDILFSGTGTIGETAVITSQPINWNIKEGVYAIKPDKAVIEPKFLMYLLKTKEVRKQIVSKAVGGTVKSVPMGELKKIIIPLPPLEVQREIVRILDHFTELTTELEEKLTAELTARKKQYAYYRDLLLTLEKDSMTILDRQTRITDSCHTVQWLTLGEIATDIYRGAGITRNQITTQGTPCVRYGEIYTTYNIWFDACVSHTDASVIENKKYFEHGDVLFAITGESVEDIAKSCVYTGHDRCLAGGDIVVLKHKQNPKYMGYVLSTTAAQKQKSKGKVKSKVVHSSVPAISQIIVPIPPLEEQERIVSILDRFDALCHDLTSGLPAEIEARRKQYEYYRDKLLSFPPLQG